MEENYLASELRAIGVRLDFLTSAVNRLEEQNENRRNAIDSVANSIRTEYAAYHERCASDFELVKREVDKLKTEMAGVRWLAIIVGGTIATYLTLKILTPEPPHDPNSGKQAFEQTFFF